MRLTSVGILITAAVLTGAQPSQEAERRFEAALHEETVAGNLQGAMAQYRVLADQPGSDRAIAARALLQLGLCQRKLGQKQEAAATFARVAQNFGDQTAQAAEARRQMAAPSASGPRNLSFELGTVGQPPLNWAVPVGSAELRRQGCHSSLGCAVIWLPGDTRFTFGNLMQQLDATPYRGKTIRVRGMLKLDPSVSTDTAQMWFRVDRPNKQMGFFDNMQERPVKASVWTPVEIVGPIANDAETINIGVISVGRGHAWVDDLSFEVVADSTPMTGKTGVSGGFADAPKNLNFATGAAGTTPEGWVAPAGMATLLRTGCHSQTGCATVILPADSNSPFANLMQMVKADPFRGKRVRLRAWVKLDSSAADDAAQMWLRVDRPNRKTGFFDNMGDRPVKQAQWTQVDIVGDIATDAQAIAFGVMSIGKGKAWVDGMTLDVVPDTTPVTKVPAAVPDAPQNLSFSQGNEGATPTGWFTPAGKTALARTGCHSGPGCVSIWLPEGSSAPFGNLMQSFNAAAYRGKTVRVRAWLRIDAVSSDDRAQMWWRVDRADQVMGSFDNMDDRPVKSALWVPAEIVAKVDADAEKLNIGVMSIGKGKAWVDGVTFEIVPDGTPSTGKYQAMTGGPVRNLNLAQGKAGSAPDGWFAGSGKAEWSNAGCRSSQGCAVVWLPSDTTQPFGNLMQTADATPYRDQTVRMRAWVRLDPAAPGDKAQLWFRVDRPNREMGFFDNMSDRPVVSSVWKQVEIVGKIASDAKTINFGLMSIGKGRAWVENITLDVVPAGTPETGAYLKH